MKFKRRSGRHFVASITRRQLCAGTLVSDLFGATGKIVRKDLLGRGRSVSGFADDHEALREDRGSDYAKISI